MGRQANYQFRDMYELHHQVDAINPRNFFQGHHIISDQIDRQALKVLWDELEAVIVRGVSGEIVEFGCYVGTSSLYIRRQLDRHHESARRAFHVYDSFQGLPAKTPQDSSAAGTEFKQGALQVSKRTFLEQFRRAGLLPPTVHKAWFSDLTAAIVPDKITLAFLDGDFYESIRDSLRLVVPAMQPGGTILIDDYAREALPGAAKAAHEFFRPGQIRTEHGLGVIRL